MSSTTRLQPSETTDGVPAVPKRDGRARVSEFLERFGLLLVLGLVLVFYAFSDATSGVFFTSANLVTLLGNQVVVLLIAVGGMIPLLGGYFDLSPGAIAGVASVATAAAMADFGLPVPVAIALAVALGAAVGFVNGFLITRYGLSAIITTLGMSLLLTGAMLLYTSGGSISTGIDQDFIAFGSLNWAGVPRLLFVLVPILVLAWLLLENSPYGRYLQALRSSRDAAALVGLNVNRIAVSSFVLGGALAGLAGVLLTARSGAADSTAGPSFLFPAYAAIFLGATSIRPGRPNLLGTVLGVFFVAVLVSGLSLLGAAVWAPSVFNGVALLVAAGIATYLARRRGARSMMH
ncbi:ABC transporter permease [Pseudonocardia pini]|uniref:ABC transporter permease n=1 Tax=Pseudonocardia pini TaxID=2758030 RepID=UPI0015F10E0F|nr:ABC transporter permease [Pseudonocardia pini]